MLPDSLSVAALDGTRRVATRRDARPEEFEAAAEDRGTTALDAGLLGGEQNLSVLEQARVEAVRDVGLAAVDDRRVTGRGVGEVVLVVRLELRGQGGRAQMLSAMSIYLDGG